MGEKVVGKINRGVCLLVGIEKDDAEQDAMLLANKVVELRIFPDGKKNMDMSLLDIQGEILAISQFTLAGSVKKGRRPSFDNAERPEKAEALFQYFVHCIETKGLKVKTGIFGEMMEVDLINQGPVTFILEAKNGIMRLY